VDVVAELETRLKGKRMTKADQSPAHAREETYPKQQRELRVLETMALMRSLQFRSGITPGELAKKWNVTLGTAHHITSEASRRVRSEVNNPEHISATLGTRIEDALLDERTETRDLAKLGDLWARLSPGVLAPTKVQVSEVDNEEARFIALPRSERAAELRATAARFLAAADELEAGEDD
jgi:hypothetical protein